MRNTKKYLIVYRGKKATIKKTGKRVEIVLNAIRFVSHKFVANTYLDYI